MGARVSPTPLARLIVIGCGVLLLGGFLAGSPVPGAVAVMVLALMAHTRGAAAASFDASAIVAQRHIPDGLIHAGDVVPVRLDATQSRLAPGVQATLWDLVPRGFTTQSTPTIHGTGRLDYEGRAEAKGSLAFLAVRVDLCDPRGLWATTRLVPTASTIRVLSGLEYLEAGRRLGRRHNLDKAVPAALGQLMRDLEFESTRPYQVGDRLRDLDWKRTAKYHGLMTKQWERQEEAAVLLLIDAGRTMRARHGGPSKLDRAMRWALELAEAATTSNHAVGYVAFDDFGVLDDMQPTRGRDAAPRMAARFAELPHDIEANRRLDVAPADEGNDAEGEVAFTQTISQLRGASPVGQQGAGVQRAIAAITARRRGQPVHIIAFTDLEAFPAASVQALGHAVRQGHSAVAAVLPGTRFLAPPTTPTLRDLENAYHEVESRRMCRSQLEARGVKLLELTPKDSALHVLNAGNQPRTRRAH